MKKKPAARILVWILTLAIIMSCMMPAGIFHAESLTGNTYYLATNGLDTNPGTIDAPFGTLLHAFQQLASGDTLIIREGTYKGYLQVIDKTNVTIKSFDGENVTIENGPVNVGYVFYAGTSSDVTISGLKFYLNEEGNNGNIAYIDTCTNLKITNCELTSGEGGIITRYGCSNLEISGNIFRNLGWALGGVLLWNANNCRIFNNVFINTDFSINLWGSETTLNQIYNNTFGSEYCDVAAQSISGIAHDNIFTNNIFGSVIQNQNPINPDSPVKNFMALNNFNNNCYNSNTFTDGIITTDDKLTLEQLKAQGVETSGFMGNPRFLNPATEEYQIGRGSDCHGTGSGLLVPLVDKMGAARTDIVDMGAYIYTDRVNYYVATAGSDTNAGTDAAPFQTIAHGISLMQPGDYLFVKAGVYGEGIGISGKSDITVRNYREDQPLVASQVDIKDSKDIAVSGFALNTSVVVGNSTNVKVSNMDVHGGHIVVVPGTDGYEISSCLIHDFQGEGAILLYNGKNGKVSNNVLYNNAGQALLLEGGESVNNSIYNNTFCNNGCDLLLVNAASIGNPSGNTFKNNIFSNGLQLGDKGFFSNNTFDYNCYNSANLAEAIGYANVYNDAGEFVETLYPSLETLKAEGVELNGFVGNPSFINPSIVDFRLRKTSDCLGKGTSEGAPLYDIKGFHRSEPFDLGAYKFTGAVNDYYVSPDGDDSNPGTPDAPYRTIQKAVNSMASGETAYIKGGVYNESIIIDNKAGTETDKFKILPWGSEEVILDSGNSGDNAITISGGSSFWNIEGISIRNYKNSGIQILGSSRITFSKTNISSISGNALYAEASNNCTLNEVKVLDAGINGISLKNSAGWSINKVYVNKAAEAAVYFDTSNGSKVKASIFTNSETGISANDSDELVVYNNDFYGNSQSDLKLGGSSVGCLIKNNIFGSADTKYSLEIADINNDIDYNCYNKASGAVAINYTSAITLDGFKALGKEAGGIQADPMYTYPVNGDFLLKPYSPCADKGITDANTPAEGYDGYRFESPADIGAMFSPYSMKTYYVAADGDDSNDGSLVHPWKTIRKGMETMRQSDTLYIRGGKYSERVNLYDKIGRSTAYYTVKNYNGEEVIMDSDFTEDVGIKFTNCSYWKIDGLKFCDYTGAAIWSTGGSSYITMENLEIYNIDNPTFHISGTEGILSDGDYHTLRNCYIHDIGQTLCERADNGVYIGYGSDHWIIDSNKFENIPGGGINLYGKPTGGDYSVITNNVVINSMFGMVLTMCKGLFISNNTLINNWGADIYTDWWINDSIIQNNILYNDMAKDAMVRVEDKENQGSTKMIGIDPVPILIQYEEVNSNIFRNNTVYSKNFGNRVMDIATVKPMEDYLKTQTLNTYINYWYQDPLLVDPANGDYRLQDSSPCIDAGVSEGAPSVDFTGAVRVYAPDLGAYENSDTSIWMIGNAVSYYAAIGELNGSLAEQLANDAEQALHQYGKGDLNKAAKHIEDLIKHLNNNALAELVTQRAKDDLNEQAANLIKLLKMK